MRGIIRTSPSIFNIAGFILPQEPLWRHCSLLIGGRADYYCVPRDEADLRLLLTACSSYAMDYFILGGGTNLLVADKGIRGAVIDMSRFDEFKIENGLLILGGGLDVSTAAWASGSMGYQGLDFLFGMPGTMGGAIWMNARCYGGEIADVLEWVDMMTPDGRVERFTFEASQWSYKTSPFQRVNGVILRGAFKISTEDPETLRQQMRTHHSDRESKGHYRAPCAGSAFKNNREFGAPSAVIIDECGLKGFTIGRAAVSRWHANIFINLGGASAADFRELMFQVADTVYKKTGHSLESEILMVGE